MASMSVTLGEYSFPSKKDAKAFFSKVLNDTELEHTLEGENFHYVMALLLNHPRAEEKIGCGVAAIKVSTGHTSSNRCFHIVRTDKSIENFSIVKCIDGDHSELHKFCLACRKVIEKDIRAYKRIYFEENSNENKMVICQSTNKRISVDEAHVDHREPLTFSVIVHFFVKANGVDLSTVKYKTQGTYGNELADTLLINSFREWHNKEAKLRIIHDKANLGKGYLGRIKTTKADGIIKK